jgi:hypothetical protein
MGGTYSTHGRDDVLVGNVKVRDKLEDLGVEGTIVLEHLIE